MTIANAFQIFMEEIWNEDAKGLYEEKHDAVKVAKEDFKGKHTGNSKLDGNYLYVFTFPDGSQICVFQSGAGLHPMRRRMYRPRKVA